MNLMLHRGLGQRKVAGGSGSGALLAWGVLIRQTDYFIFTVIIIAVGESRAITAIHFWKGFLNREGPLNVPNILACVRDTG